MSSGSLSLQEWTENVRAQIDTLSNEHGLTEKTRDTLKKRLAFWKPCDQEHYTAPARTFSGPEVVFIDGQKGSLQLEITSNIRPIDGYPYDHVLQLQMSSNGAYRASGTNAEPLNSRRSISTSQRKWVPYYGLGKEIQAEFTYLQKSGLLTVQEVIGMKRSFEEQQILCRRPYNDSTATYAVSKTALSKEGGVQLLNVAMMVSIAGVQSRSNFMVRLTQISQMNNKQWIPRCDLDEHLSSEIISRGKRGGLTDNDSVGLKRSLEDQKILCKDPYDSTTIRCMIRDTKLSKSQYQNLWDMDFKMTVVSDTGGQRDDEFTLRAPVDQPVQSVRYDALE